MVYPTHKKGGESNASILCEMPCQKGNEGCQEHHHEERQTSNPGCMPHMRNQDVQNRQGLKPVLGRFDYRKGWVSFLCEVPSLVYICHYPGMDFCYIDEPS